MKPTEWVASANADNSAATATKSAVADKRHTAAVVVASYSTASTSGLLTITYTIGATSTTVTHYVHGADVIPLELRGDINTLVSAGLAASGTGGVVGRVNLIGHTTG
jgi:hypothetical protein